MLNIKKIYNKSLHQMKLKINITKRKNPHSTLLNKDFMVAEKGFEPMTFGL